jgi:hypothetical protein
MPKRNSDAQEGQRQLNLFGYGIEDDPDRKRIAQSPQPNQFLQDSSEHIIPDLWQASWVRWSWNLTVSKTGELHILKLAPEYRYSVLNHPYSSTSASG